jgi:homocysteine S-methyltransferase
MMNWTSILEKKPYLLLDGAMGTCIEKKGDVLDPLLWSAGQLVTNPSLIKQIHLDYLLAGADIVTTSAYQVSYEGFQTKYSYCVEQVDDLLRYSTDLGREAIKEFHEVDTKNVEEKFVAASVGCYGAHLANGSEFFGAYSVGKKELFDWHFPKLQVLLRSKPDMIGFETVPLLEEVKAVSQLLNTIPTTMPVWLSCACKSSEHLNGGDSVEDVCRFIEDPNNEEQLTPDGTLNLKQLAIGVNCTAPEHIESIILTMKDCCHSRRPIIVYPNRGDFWNEESHSYSEVLNWSPTEFAQKGLEWYELGARIIGGCCKTDPTYIKALSETLRREGR